MTAWTRRRLRASVKMGLAAMPFSVAIRVATGGFIPGALVLGFGVGFAVGIAELFVFRRWLRDFPFLLHIIVKSLALVLVMWFAFAVLNLIDVADGEITLYGWVMALIDPETLLGLLEYLAVIAFLLFFVQLDRLLGPGVLLGYVSGRYHHPRHEDRIFMFLDLQGSTTLADRMAADRYFEFLHRYFTEMSEPILETDAQIYQYVGDEVVLTWKKENGIEEANCIRVFFLIAEHVRANRERFLRDFGAVPVFKAGVHAGEVITAQIGELKKEIVYNGDVLNTAARIQAKCNELGQSLLVSAELYGSLDLGSAYRVEPLGPVPLRGKAEPIELYAIHANHDTGHHGPDRASREGTGGRADEAPAVE